METLVAIGESLKYIQEHGGIMMIFIFAGMVRSVDLFRIHKKIEEVERRAVDRTAVHELFYHNIERNKP